jgi:transcriptional regulator with GAF, ATPase, and Fis domain
VGRFELADGGTIFLDEIGELSVEIQGKLLRVLQEGECERVGGTETKSVDVRVLAATNRDLEQGMDQGTFRADLYYRLNVFPLHIPPLRDRKADIPLLAWHFVGKHQNRMGKTIRQIPADVIAALGDYHWPGNVRELENVIERALILSQGSELSVERPFGRRPDPETLKRRRSSTPLIEVEREHIFDVLESTGWVIKGPDHAAERLGLNPSTLLHRMKKLGITRPPGSLRPPSGSA